MLLLAIGVLGILALGVSLFRVAGALAGAEAMAERIRVYALFPELAIPRRRHGRGSVLDRMRIRLNTRLSALASEGLRLQLLRADWRVTVTEFLVIRIGLTLAGLFLGWLLSRSFLSGVGLAVIAYMVPGIYLRWSINRRQIRFERQLVDVLVLLSGAVRAGVSLLQAMELVVREMEPPASEEFRRVLHEVNLGVTLPQALRNLAARMENKDLDLVVTAIDIQYQVGGKMATMLTAVTEKIRQRVRLFGEVRVLTTQQRYTGYLLAVLPIFVGALMFMINPEYMGRLFEPGPMLVIPIAAAFGVIAGHLVIKRIAKIEV